jgi:hypothetical protein
MGDRAEGVQDNDLGGRTERRFFAARSDGSTPPSRQPDEPEAVPKSYQDQIIAEADERARSQHPSSAPAEQRDLARLVEEKLREDLTRYTGWPPERVELHSRVQGDASSIRQRRRAMGLGAIDGYPKLTPVEEDRQLHRLLAAGATEREIARALFAAATASAASSSSPSTRKPSRTA